MKKKGGAFVLALLGAAWGFAQIQHQVTVVNISVPVRVFDGSKFVDSLGLGDFEVDEDGRAQPVEAVYLVRGGTVQRQEGAPGAPGPETRRNFVLLFQLSEYLPEIDKAVDVFFESVCRPGDEVDIVTPQRTLRLRSRIDTPEKVRRARSEVKSKLRNDVLVLSGAYRSVIEDMLAHLGAGDPETAEVDLNGYRTDLERFEALRTIEPARMAAFAADLKTRPGSKHAFLFFQREKVPQFDDRRLIEALNSNDSETAIKANELMAVYNRDAEIDREAIQRAFSDASADVHFLYITRNRRDPQLDVENMAVLDGIRMAESSAAIYRVFREIAAATGGTSAASANPAALLRKAVAASEQYYLLYYQPREFRADGQFRRIEVTGQARRASHQPPGGLFRGRCGRPSREAVGLPEEAIAQEVEDIDLVAPAKGGPVPESVLRAAAVYCRALTDASLDFVCREDVRERLSDWLARSRPAAGRSNRSSQARGVVADKVRNWVYDYQLVRKEGWAAETRILLEEDGKPRRERERDPADKPVLAQVRRPGTGRAVQRRSPAGSRLSRRPGNGDGRRAGLGRRRAAERPGGVFALRQSVAPAARRRRAEGRVGAGLDGATTRGSRRPPRPCGPSPGSRSPPTTRSKRTVCASPVPTKSSRPTGRRGE